MKSNIIYNYIFLIISLILNDLNVLVSINIIKKKWLISTKGCKIPALPIINSSLKKNMVHTTKANCTQNMHLLDNNSTHIWIKEEFLDFYNVFDRMKDFYCCYRYFYAKNNIMQIVYGPCIEFSTVIKAEHEFTQVECFYLEKNIYKDFFLFPMFTKAKVEVTANKSVPHFNVLLMGIESMSRLNFLRMMPNTSKFLQERGSIQLLGYNKVGDNSFPNLFPLLFSRSYEQIKDSCIFNNVIDTSRCSFIWNKFKEVSYNTALASDSIAALLGNYEYSLPTIPTDFYLQPFMFETRNIFKNKQYNFHQCLHKKYFYELLLNWTAELLKKINSRLFGIFWEESVTHENFNLPQNIDASYLNFFKDLESSKYLDESIVILFSDHGMRWGEMALTKQGRLENRLPIFEVMFPRKFQAQYPLALKNFKKNKYRLTSPYDIHETLLHLLQNDLEDNEIRRKSKQIDSRTCKVSLFLAISEQRTCNAIGISEHWCTCQKNDAAGLEETKLYAANYLINHINGLLENYSQCHQLKIQKVLTAKMAKDTINNQTIFHEIVLLTLPGGGIFEGTLLERNGEFSISGTVSRLNLYRYTSMCVQDDNFKMYCTCK